MELSIASLKAAGAFTGAPVKKTVTWWNGEEELSAIVYVRPLSYQSAVSDITSMAQDKEGAAGRIASCIVDESGKPIFTVEDITGEADPERGPLSSDLTMALLGVIGEVSGLGKRLKLMQRKKSGVSSSSTGSAGERSRKQKSESHTESS